MDLGPSSFGWCKNYDKVVARLKSGSLTSTERRYKFFVINVNLNP